MTTPYTLDTLDAFVGKEIGVSHWFVIDQGRIDAFGAATYDIDPQHMDPDWARENSPFGGTIAYGFQTLSMLAHLTREGDLMPDGADVQLNYGLDRVRFIRPVPVGSRIRCRSRLLEVRRRSEGVYVIKTENVVEIEGEDEPAMVAEWLGLCAKAGADPSAD